MEFVNHTPFPALAFQGVDQRRQSFHVVVLRQTFKWDDVGALSYADEQEALCEVDEYFGAGVTGSVRQESDLCPYKPRCDVIVVATAWAPLFDERSLPRQFETRLVVRRPDLPMPLPEEPQGLNPLMPASREEMAAWQTAVAEAKMRRLPGERLIDKTLMVTGERHFVRRSPLARMCSRLLAIATLGGVRLPSWRLTPPEPVESVPLRDELAFGGQCRVDADHPSASAVSRKHRLTAVQLAAHPDADSVVVPVAHEAYSANPSGRGFAPDWYLKATGLQVVDAPQIEHRDSPTTERPFEQARAGRPFDGEAPSAAYGVRPKGHPARARLCGTIDRDFIEGDAPLPEDFDFAVWNAAQPDQQTRFLQGDEVFELVNLCPPDEPALRRDGAGIGVLRLRLPGYLPFVLVRLEDGAIAELPAMLDSVLVDTERRQLNCVWRAAVGMEPEVRVLEARMLQRHDIEALKAQCREGAEPPHG